MLHVIYLTAPTRNVQYGIRDGHIPYLVDDMEAEALTYYEVLYEEQMSMYDSCEPMQRLHRIFFRIDRCCEPDFITRGTKNF